MNALGAAIWIEYKKAMRSRVPLFTALGFLLVPLASAFTMFIYKDPEFARMSGIISAKVELAALSADWPTYLGMLAQATAIAGVVISSLIASWVFGREFSDGTLKDLLAVPVARSTVVVAKFVVIAVWVAVLIVMMYVVGVIAGSFVGMPESAADIFVHGSIVVLVTGCLVIAIVTPVGLFASVGRGYLPPMGLVIVAVAFGNIIAITGRGEYFPWSIPALYAGAGGAQQPSVGAISFVIILATGIAGIVATSLWWKRADQNR